LNIDGRLLILTPEGSSPIPVSIVPEQGFQQEIRLSCANDLPAGYICAFSPVSLRGGGVSSMTIQRSGLVGETFRRSRWNGAAWGFVVFVLVGSLSVGSMAGRSSLRLAILLVVFSLAFLTGCGTSALSQRYQMRVLTIQSTLGLGSSSIVHSAQVELEVTVPELN
jgi:hypothetical protein